jgi:hypothetical protein
MILFPTTHKLFIHYQNKLNKDASYTQKQKKAKVSTKTTKKSKIKPRSPAAAPFDLTSK